MQNSTQFKKPENTLFNSIWVQLFYGHKYGNINSLKMQISPFLCSEYQSSKRVESLGPNPKM